MKKVYLLMFLICSIGPLKAANYWFKLAVANPTVAQLNVTANWSSTIEGTGSAPTNFIGHNLIFKADNNSTTTFTINQIWNLTNSTTIEISAGVALIVSGTGNIRFTTPSQGRIPVNVKGTLEVATNSYIPRLSTSGYTDNNTAGGTVRYTSSAVSPVQSIVAATYNNLYIANSLKSTSGDFACSGTLTFGTAHNLDIVSKNVSLGNVTYFSTSSNFQSNSSTFLTCNQSASLQFDPSNNNIGGIAVNACAVSLPANYTINLYGSLDVVGGGSFTVSSSGAKLLLSSFPSSQGRIGDLSDGSVTGNGNIYIERLIESAGTRLYWEIATPITTTVSAWQNGGSAANSIYITGSFTGASAIPGVSSSTASMFILDANAALWSSYPKTSNTQPLTAGVGYRTFIRDCGSGCTSTVDKTITNQGDINQGDFSFTLGWNGTGFPGTVSLPAGGWNLLGNPYPSAINCDMSYGWNSTNIDGSFYVYDHSTKSYLSATGGAGDFSTIAQGQAFWVRISDGETSGSLTITEAAKNIDAGYELLRGVNKKQNFLKLTLADGVTKSTAYLRVNELASDSFDVNQDAYNVNTEGTSNKTYLSSLMKKHNHKMAINAFPLENVVDTVHLYVNATDNALSIITIDSLQNYNATADVFLYDAYKDTLVDLNLANSYSFTVDKTNAATYGGARLSILLDNTANQVPTSATSAQNVNGFNVYPNPTENKTFRVDVAQEGADISIVNVNGQVVYTTKMESTSEVVTLPSNVPAGVYVIKASQNAGVNTMKLVIK